MLLKSIKYQQFVNEPRKWILNEVGFNNVNLLVGKNASGKSKTLSVITGISNILSENKPLPFKEGENHIQLQNDNDTYSYSLCFHDYKISEEKLDINGINKITRGQEGIGEIQSIETGPNKFEIPSNELIATRRDKTNYPYLEEINDWAKHVRHISFNNDASNKGTFLVDDPTKPSTEFNLKNTLSGLSIAFNSGKKKHAKSFTDKIISDFNSIGYNITDIDLGIPASINVVVESMPNTPVFALRVKELDLECWTDQWDMSTGMFSALSTIIYFNYYELENIPGLILIDDIGEGLDFERSSKLIELLISKVEQNINMQLIMSTNDRFVMNNVDIKYWQIIDREGCSVKYYNLNNSLKNFNDFKFTGLNNFDFFATDFFKKGFQAETDEK